MAKDTSNKPFFKNSVRFNEQVNAILLIMFLTVSVILCVKGCGTCLFQKDQSKQDNITENGVVTSDSIKSDSIISVQ